MADLRLPDGSRVNATIPPATPDGPTLSIRRFGRRRLRAAELQKLGAFSETMGTFLGTAVRHRLNLLISGGTGAGKSTLLGALAESISAAERIVTIEDTLELILDQQNWVRLERGPRTWKAGADHRARPRHQQPADASDRVIVGEVRGGEALDMLQAMNTGHDGSLGTVHANSPRDALSRLETMVLMAGIELPSRAVREQIVSALDLIVHIERSEDGVRRVAKISEVVGLEGDTPLLQDVFVFERQGVERGRVRGDFVASGFFPAAWRSFAARRRDPLDWFSREGRARVRRFVKFRAGPLLCLLLGLACASTGDKRGPDDPEVRLRGLLDEWYAVRDNGGSCASGGRKYPYVDCGRIQATIERLALEFPSHPSILIANAVVAHQTHQPEKAVSYLDALIEQDRVQPGAAVLRSRLAIQQGNLPFAQRLLEEQVALSPDEAALREALASVHYLMGAFDRARRELLVAQRLGAPAWRVAYNRGLLEEAQGDPDAAMDFYRQALEEKPDWQRAHSRLRGLESERGL